MIANYETRQLCFHRWRWCKAKQCHVRQEIEKEPYEINFLLLAEHLPAVAEAAVDIVAVGAVLARRLAAELAAGTVDDLFIV